MDQYEIHKKSIELDKDKEFHAKYGRDNYYREWMEKVPYVRWQRNWNVKAIPPFGGALIRYVVTDNVGKDARVSIYLDGDNSLGIYGGMSKPLPYWEIHPYDDDVFRCGMKDVDTLVSAVRKSLRDQNHGN